MVALLLGQYLNRIYGGERRESEETGDEGLYDRASRARRVRWEYALGENTKAG